MGKVNKTCEVSFCVIGLIEVLGFMFLAINEKIKKIDVMIKSRNSL